VYYFIVAVLWLDSRWHCVLQGLCQRPTVVVWRGSCRAGPS